MSTSFLLYESHNFSSFYKVASNVNVKQLNLINWQMAFFADVMYCMHSPLDMI